MEKEKQSLRSLLGLWADLGPAPSEEEIDEARREAWATFPREDIVLSEDAATGSTIQRSLYGLWAGLGPDLSAEEIDEVRREEWANFPREDV